MNPFPFVLSEWRQSRGTLTAMAFLIAIAGAISLGITSVERAVRESSARAATHFDLIIGAAGSETQLVLTTVYLQPAALRLMPLEVLQRLRADPGVVMATPIATGDSYQGFPIVGVDEAFISRQGRTQLAEGRVFRSDQEAVLGAAVPMQLGESYTPLHGSAGENAIETHPHLGTQITAVGRAAVSGTPWDRAILIPFDAMLRLHQTSAHSVSGVPAIVVQPRSVMDAYRLRTLYRNSTTTAVFPAETLTSLYVTLGDVRTLVVWISLAGQALVLCAVILGFYAILSARRAQTAVLRAIGAGPFFIWVVLWLQGMGMLVVGLIGAVVLGLAASALAAKQLSSHLSFAVHAGLQAQDLVPLAVVISAGALASSIVAWRVGRESLALAIRN